MLIYYININKSQNAPYDELKGTLMQIGKSPDIFKFI